MKVIYEKMDEMKLVFPNIKAVERLQMEKGFMHCATKSSAWIEELLSIMEAEKSNPYTVAAESHKPVNPIYTLVDNNLQHTNSIVSIDPLVKKKKSFLQVASEAAKDMGKDFFNSQQENMRGEKK